MASSNSYLFSRRLNIPSRMPCLGHRPASMGLRRFATEAPPSTPIAVLDRPSPSPILSVSPVSSSKTLIIPPLPQLSKGRPLPAQFAKPNAFVTLYTFPSLEPVRFASYPAAHLLLPIRKDLLQRAVVHEVDCSTQGSANTKWRDDVHGSGRKIRPQKGTGKARLGDKKSPMLRGGGVAHGPKPRDFSTELPQKIYDMALRTALSFRYARGDLIVVDGPIEIPFNLKAGARPVDPLKAELSGHLGDLAEEIYARLGWVKGVHGSRCLFVTERENPSLTIALESRPRLGRAVLAEDVEVRDILKMNHVVIEKKALNRVLINHQTDLIRHQGFNPTASTDPKVIHSLYKQAGAVEA